MWPAGDGEPTRYDDPATVGDALTSLATAAPTTGAATNADSLPTGVLYVNGTANGATVTVTNITTGRYKAAVTFPSRAAGDVVDIHIPATVGGVVGGGGSRPWRRRGGRMVRP